MSRATVRRWIEGFEAARALELAALRPEDVSRAAEVALQLSEAALGARAPEMKARRDADDRRVRDAWCRLKHQSGRNRSSTRTGSRSG